VKKRAIPALRHVGGDARCLVEVILPSNNDIHLTSGGASKDNPPLTTKDEPLPTTTANGPTHEDNPRQGKPAAEDPNNGANRRAAGSGWRQWSEFGGGRFSFRESERQIAVLSQAT
jgi:hypothetical protein